MSGPDHGSQPERTSLAWQRTGLAAAVASVLLLRDGFVHGAPVEIVAGACLAGAVMVTVVRIARPPVREGASRLMLLLLTTPVVIAGVLTVVWLLTARPMR